MHIQNLFVLIQDTLCIQNTKRTIQNINVSPILIAASHLLMLKICAYAQYILQDTNNIFH